MWRVLLIVGMLVAGMLGPTAAAQEGAATPPDLAAMLVPPSALPEAGYQFARGGYLTPDDARYLLGDAYALDAGAVETMLSAAWTQGYTGTYVLLEDRSYVSSEPLARVTTTIHELDDADGAVALAAVLAAAPPEGAEGRDAAVAGATTWRVVTSQEDTLRTVARAGRFVVEVVSADAARTPADGDHAAVVDATLARVEAAAGSGLSLRVVGVADSRLLPVTVPLESPLVHTFYRLLDGEVIPAAGELEAPNAGGIARGVEEVVVARQTAELASQDWLTAAVVVARFASTEDAAAFDGVMRDPLDFFPETEEARAADDAPEGLAVEALSGETTVGGRYSGYRLTLAEGDTVAQLTIRSMGSSLIARDAAEGWAERQRACLAGDGCEPVPLETLLRTPDPATPVAGDLAAGRYASPAAPWAIAFDPAVWRVDDAFAQGGYDYLYLRSDRMDATLETIVDHHGEPEQCVLGELNRLREDEDRARISVGSGVEGEQPGGLEPGHGWIVYTVEPLEDARAGEEYVIRIDCYTVVAGTTSLVVQTRAPSHQWADVAPLGDALRAQIEIDGAPVSGVTGDPLTLLPARSDDMINRRPWVGIAA